jgi:hypothetical protein
MTSSLKMDQARLGTVQEECAKYQTRVTQFSDGFADSVAASNMAHEHAMNAGKGQASTTAPRQAFLKFFG